jgi:hypothetical protein
MQFTTITELVIRNPLNINLTSYKHQDLIKNNPGLQYIALSSYSLQCDISHKKDINLYEFISPRNIKYDLILKDDVKDSIKYDIKINRGYAENINIKDAEFIYDIIQTYRKETEPIFSLYNAEFISDYYIYSLYTTIHYRNYYLLIARNEVNIYLEWSLILKNYGPLSNIIDENFTMLSANNTRINMVGIKMILSLNAPIEILILLIERGYKPNDIYLSLNKHLTEEFVEKYFHLLDLKMLQYNITLPIDFIIKFSTEHKCFNPEILGYRLDLDIEILTKYKDTFPILPLCNPAITFNIMKEHDLELNDRVFNNPSLTYENIKSPEFKVLFDEFGIKDYNTIALLSNEYEYDNRIMILNKILEKKKPYIKGINLITVLYFPSVICKIISDYQFYR